MSPPHLAHRHPPAWAIGAAGLLSLAVAMGIGRFAFTPMLPLMVQAGQLDVAGGGWLAAANYAGYLLGALTAARTGWPAARLAVIALVATAVPTPAYSALLQAVGPTRARVARHQMLVATKAQALATPASRRSAAHQASGPGSAIAAVSTAVATRAITASRAAGQPVRGWR